jgi:hypothetical protein
MEAPFLAHYRSLIQACGGAELALLSGLAEWRSRQCPPAEIPASGCLHPEIDMRENRTNGLGFEAWVSKKLE